MASAQSDPKQIYFGTIEMNRQRMERTVKRNHCVITFVFNEDDIKYIEKFLRKIKKISKIYVECIYTDLYILYASKNYQRMFPNFKKNHAT